MSNKARIEDNHLYITYDVYDYGHREKTKIIPVGNIECIKAVVGIRGGMHGWSLKGYHPDYSNKDYNKGNERDIDLFCGDRKNTDLISRISKLLPNCNYYEKVESGGAAW